MSARWTWLVVISIIQSLAMLRMRVRSPAQWTAYFCINSEKSEKLDIAQAEGGLSTYETAVFVYQS